MASLPEMALPPPTSGQVRAPAPFDPTRWVGQACAALMNPYCIVESNGKRWLCYRPPVVGPPFPIAPQTRMERVAACDVLEGLDRVMGVERRGGNERAATGSSRT